MLTVSKIESLPAPEKTFKVYWDSSPRGFGVRVYPSGAKSYVLGHRKNGKYRLQTIAKTNKLKLSSARQVARELLSEGKYGALTLHSSDLKLSELWELWADLHGRKKKSFDTDVQRWERYLSPELGSKKIEEITRVDIIRLHARLSRRVPVQANHVVRQLRAMYNKAILWEKFKGNNPAANIELNKEKPRTRYLSSSETEKLLRALKELRNPVSRDAIILLLLTGRRKRELLKAKWSDFDKESSTLKLYNTKADRPITCYLSMIAMRVILSMPRKSEYMFPGPKGGPLRDIRASWKTIQKRCSLEDVNIHDLRHTFATNLLSKGVSLPLIQKLLDHSNIVSTQRYAHVISSAEREAVEVASESLESYFENGPCLNSNFLAN